MTPKSANQIVDMSFYGGAMHPGEDFHLNLKGVNGFIGDILFFLFQDVKMTPKMKAMLKVKIRTRRIIVSPLRSLLHQLNQYIRFHDSVIRRYIFINGFVSRQSQTYSAPTNAPVAHHQPVAPAAPAPAATTPAAPEVATWLQCEIIECEKWRRIPSWVLADRLADLRKRTFYCYLVRPGLVCCYCHLFDFSSFFLFVTCGRIPIWNALTAQMRKNHRILLNFKFDFDSGFKLFLRFFPYNVTI